MSKINRRTEGDMKTSIEENDINEKHQSRLKVAQAKALKSVIISSVTNSCNKKKLLWRRKHREESL